MSDDDHDNDEDESVYYDAKSVSSSSSSSSTTSRRSKNAHLKHVSTQDGMNRMKPTPAMNNTKEEPIVECLSSFSWKDPTLNHTDHLHPNSMKMYSPPRYVSSYMNATLDRISDHQPTTSCDPSSSSNIGGNDGLYFIQDQDPFTTAAIETPTVETSVATVMDNTHVHEKRQDLQQDYNTHTMTSLSTDKPPPPPPPYIPSDHVVDVTRNNFFPSQEILQRKPYTTSTDMVENDNDDDDDFDNDDENSNDANKILLTSSQSSSPVTHSKNITHSVGDEQGQDQDQQNGYPPYTIPLSSSMNPEEEEEEEENNQPRRMQDRMRSSSTASLLSSTCTTNVFLDSKAIPKNTVPIKCIRKFSSSSSEFHPLLLIHSIIQAHTGPIWKGIFSLDGSYFCTGGKDGFILLWAVGGASGSGKDRSQQQQQYVSKPSKIQDKIPTFSSVDSNKSSTSTSMNTTSTTTTTTAAAAAAPTPTTWNNTNTPPLGINVPILSSQPIRTFRGHTLDVVDLSWSSSSYLLSASLDKTIRLWHPSRETCLKTFYASEILTSVSFHPTDDRYFLSAGFDKKCCIWSIPMESIAEWAQAPTFVSAARFTPDTKYIVAGLVNGMVIIYSLTCTIITTTIVDHPTSTYPRSRVRTASLVVTSIPSSTQPRTNTTTTSSSMHSNRLPNTNDNASSRDTSDSFRDIPNNNNSMTEIQFVLRFYTQISCKKSRSKEGKKVTGFAFLQNLSEDKVLLESTKKMTSVRGIMDRRGKISNMQVQQQDDDDVSVQDTISTHNHTSDTIPSRKKHFTTSSIRDHLKYLTHVSGIHTSTRIKQNKVKQKLLVSTNDSRLRLIGLDDFCTVRQYKGSMINNNLQIQARFSESGEYIVCGSESGTVVIWNTATKGNPLNMVVSGLTNYDKVNTHECFEASKANPPIVTDTIFVPSKSMKEALRASRMFPSMDFVSNVAYDMSSAAIVSCDYEGTIRVFLRKSCLDAVYNAAIDPIV